MAAEGLGLFFSVVALYRAAADAHILIQRGHNFHRDYDILLTELEAERAKLLLWGYHVGLVSATRGRIRPNKTLYLEDILPTIRDILQSIHDVFEEAQTLASKYGLEKIVSSPEEAHQGKADAVLFPKSSIQFRGRPQRRVNILMRTRWAIQDKEKFASMIADLRNLNENLDQVTSRMEKLDARERSFRLKWAVFWASMRLRFHKRSPPLSETKTCMTYPHGNSRIVLV